MVQTSPWIRTAASSSTLLPGMRVASSSAWRPTLLATPPGGSSSPFMVNPRHTRSCKYRPAAHQMPSTIHLFGPALSLTQCTLLCLQCVPDPTPEVLEALRSQSECQRLRAKMPSCRVRSTASHHPPSAGPGRGTLSPHSLPGKPDAPQGCLCNKIVIPMPPNICFYSLNAGKDLS